MTVDRPPPTSYRDEAGTFHPGPGCNGYREHMVACDPCLSGFIRAGAAGEAWAMAMPPVVQRMWPARSRALVATPRSLPARWRRYATPVPLVCFACGSAGVLLLPASVGATLLIALLVVVAVIHRHVPDPVPAARARRGGR